MKVTTAAILDKRKKRKSSNTLPVVIRVTFNRIPIKFPVGIDLTQKDFEKLSSPRLGEELTALKKKIDEEHDRAKKIIKKLNPFSFDGFREVFYEDKPVRKREKKIELVTAKAEIPEPEVQEVTAIKEAHKTKFRNQYGARKYPTVKSKVNYFALGEVARIYGKYIKSAEAEKRIGSVINYFNSLMSLLAFQPDLKFKEITKAFLFRYETWMIEKNNSYATIGIYLRPLRAIYRQGIKAHKISKAKYPFGKGEYVIPKGRKNKKPASQAILKKLYNHEQETACESEMMCLDYWFFIYYGNGLNMKDVALLKYGNIDNGFIRIYRAKTINTTRDEPKIISIFINEDMKRIISKWGNADRTPGNYIFPILTPSITAYRQRELIHLFTKRVNNWMREIVACEDIDEKITGKRARDYFATVLRDAGVTISFISGALGHADIKTTENYFGAYEDNQQKAIVSHLEGFKKIV